MGAAAPIIGLALTAASVVHGVKVAGDAADEQEDIAKAQAASAAQKRMEERRAAFRKRRIQRARVLQSSENTGVSGSSAESGALSSIATQGAATRAGISAHEKNRAIIQDAQTNLNELQVEGQIGSAVGRLGGSIFQAGGGFGALGIGNSPKNTGSPFYQE